MCCPHAPLATSTGRADSSLCVCVARRGGRPRRKGRLPLMGIPEKARSKQVTQGNCQPTDDQQQIQFECTLCCFAKCSRIDVKNEKHCRVKLYVHVDLAFSGSTKTEQMTSFASGMKHDLGMADVEPRLGKPAFFLGRPPAIVLEAAIRQLNSARCAVCMLHRQHHKALPRTESFQKTQSDHDAIKLKLSSPSQKYQTDRGASNSNPYLGSEEHQIDHDAITDEINLLSIWWLRGDRERQKHCCKGIRGNIFHA